MSWRLLEKGRNGLMRMAENENLTFTLMVRRLAWLRCPARPGRFAQNRLLLTVQRSAATKPSAAVAPSWWMASRSYPATIRRNAPVEKICQIEGLARSVNEKPGCIHSRKPSSCMWQSSADSASRPDHDLVCFAAAKPGSNQQDIRTALKDTLCRCAGYPSIENAIQAQRLRCAPAKPVRPPGWPSRAANTG